MSQEIVYTSAPQGLKAGSRGFCTVVSTPGMAVNLAERLESLSGYRHAFMPHEAQAVHNPVNFSHLIVALGGRRYHILSRVADAGLDYTQRSNKLAHHVALEVAEVAAAPGGPAWALADPDFCIAKWDGKARIVPAGHVPRNDNCPSGICQAWQKAAGDAGWAGVLAESAQTPANQPRYVIFPVGMSVLPLVVEALSLLPPARRWEVSFCTYYTKLPAGLDCKWRFVLDGTAEADALRRNPHSDAIDLCARLPAAKGGELVAAARSGKSSFANEPTPSAGRPAHPRLVGASRPRPGAPLPSQELDPLAPPLADPPLAPSVATRGFAPVYSDSAKPRPTDRGSKLKLVMAIAFLVPIVCGLLVAVFLAGGKFAGAPTPVARHELSPDDSRIPATGSSARSGSMANEPDNRRVDQGDSPVAETTTDDNSRPTSRPKERGSRRPKLPGDEQPSEPDGSPAVPAVPASDSVPGDAPPAPDSGRAPPPPAAEPPISPPPPPPPADRDPFEDLIARHHLLQLPDLPGPGKSNDPKELAKLFVASPAEVSLSLKGADIAFGSDRGTELRPVPTTSAGNADQQTGSRTWQLVRLKAGLGKDDIIGSFQLTDQSLRFAWEKRLSETTKPERLRFALLEVRVGGERLAVCRFVEPKEHPIPGVKLVAAQWSVRIPRSGWDHLAAEKHLRLEIRPSGFPRQKPLAQPILKLGDPVDITIPAADPPHDKALQLTVAFREEGASKDTEVHVASKMFPLFKDKPLRAFEHGIVDRVEELKENNSRNDTVLGKALDKAQKELKVLQDAKRDYQKFAEKPKDKKGLQGLQPDLEPEIMRKTAEIQAIRNDIEFCAKENEWFTSLQKDFTEIESQARIDYTLFYEIDGQRIELVRSIPIK